MLLSRLELNGFKSFPDKVNLRFDEGIMGVVGPNGCGKTNILDSIRWVLGEQRTSLLRAGKSDEIIFNGTTNLRPADMAEVTLTIKNNRGVLPLEYDEVEVTRRIFRSGETEYMLNKNRCRLKDITDLFADTGMGIHAYSIFQQGMVDAVLSDKAEERRFLFEEAAGITKYKNRKKEALKKLENTENDLVRLFDIISEIGKNVRSLQRQAGKARRYKTLKQELQQLEILRASAKVYDLQQKMENHESGLTERKTEKESLSSQHDSREAEVQELKFQVDALNEKISAQAAREADFSQQALKSENRLTTIQARLEAGHKNVELWTSDIENLKKRIDTLGENRTQTEQRRVETAGQLEELKAQIGQFEAKVIETKESLDKAMVDVDTIREKLHRCENELSTDRAKLEAANNAIERLKNHNRDLDETLSRYEARKKSSQENLDIQKDNLNACEDEIDAIDKNINTNQQKHLQLNAEIDEIKRQISSAQAEKSGVEAKIEVLSKMVLEHEGYGSGVKALFAWDKKPEGIIDTLANLITADKEYHLAVEAALNVYGQLVVCRTRQEAMQGIEFLAQSQAGRVGFLILDGIPGAPISNSSNKGENFLGTVADLITCQDYLKKAVNCLFGNMAVYKANGIPENCNSEAVDLTGEYCSGFGIIEGGKSGVILVGRKSELADLQDLAETVLSKIETLTNNLEDKREQLAKTGAEAEKLKQEKKTHLNKRESLISEMTRLEFEFKDSISRLTELQQSTSENIKQSEAMLAERFQIEERLQKTESDKLQIAGEFENLTSGHKTLASGYDQAVSQLNQQRLKLVELTGLTHKLDEDVQRFAEMIEEAVKMIEQKQVMIDQEQSSWQELEDEQGIIKSQIAKLFEARDEVGSEKNTFNNQKNELAAKLNDAETFLKNLRTKINSLNEEIHQEELKFSEYENAIKNIAEQIYHEYGIRLSSEKPEEFDETQIEANIERWRKVLERIGQVNMLADEEYTTEKGRLEFLEKQCADLQEAKKSLLDVISKINKTAEEKFSDTFGLVKENFQGIFGSLFEGGTAQISLVDESNPLESPIDILARPGSKKTVSVSQLSGGERALTAISLLFAIYMVKPSPFCILDEIDAPLDDANVTRFLKMIHKFTHSTQFIVITHNKKTMEAADLLYGVTMERPGVSNIVSVKFNGNLVENVQ